MALNYTSDIMTLFASKIANDANYQSPGNFGLSQTLTGDVNIHHVTVTAAGSYTTAPTLSPASGSATFTVLLSLLGTTSLAAAGTVYTPGDVLTLTGGTKTVSAQVTVSTVKLISATVNAGGTGYGSTQTFNVTVVGGTSTTAAVISVTSNGGGVVTTINSVGTAGSYTVLPSLVANAATGGSGTGLTLNLVFGVNTFTVTRPGTYTVLPANAVATTGGTGTGATLTTAWGVTAVTIAVNDIYTAAPVLTFSGGAATAIAVLGSAGTSFAVGDEQKLLMMVELLRSMLAEANNSIQVKDLHTVLSRMLSQIKGGGTTTGAGADSFNATTLAANAQAEGLHYIALNPKRLTNLSIYSLADFIVWYR